MDAIPWFSTFTASTELAVTAAVFYVFHRAIEHGEFAGRVLGAAIAYEVLFNISYMTSRLFTHDHGTHHADWMVATLAGHGALSLAMFVGLLVFSFLAWRGHRQGRNVFAEHQRWTAAFAGLWMVSLLSGEIVFLFEYVGHY
jgi:uncharacterized membrane protein YozB (DUF420 family)